MYRLVMLDLDGTLVDTAPDIAAAASAALAESRLGPVNEAQVRGWIGRGAREFMKQAYVHAKGTGIACAVEQPELDAALRAFEWHYAAQSGRHGAPFPGAADSLRRLRSLGIATALVSNKETRYAAAVLHAHDLWDCFDAVICGDMVDQRKPDPMGARHCLARFRTAPGRALFLGDSDIDVATARNAGVAVWTVSYGYHCGRLVGEARPDRVVPNVAAVVEAIEQTVPT
jgi:phosphoglycolate phosphatase